MTNTTNSSSQRRTAPQVLTLPAMRRLSERLLGPPESRRSTIAVAAVWRALTVIGAAAFALAIAQVSRVHFLGYGRRLAAGVKACRTLVPRLRPSGSESGQALIEFAFILPIMLVFLLVLVDFGLALDHRQVIQHAVREGARYGAVHPVPADIIADTVTQSGGWLAATDVSVCYATGPDGEAAGNVGSYVRVAVNYTYKFSVGSGELLSTLGLGAPSINMNPSAEARLEAPATGATPC